MGLRAKVLIVMVLLLTMMAVLSTAFVRARSGEAIRLREENDSARDMRLLLAVLNSQLVQIDGVLRSWSHWTAFYDHAARPDEAFRREELSAEAVAVSQADWLGLVDNQGQVADEVTVPIGVGADLLLAPNQTGTRAQKAQRLAALRDARPRACGVAQIEDYLSFACYRPLLNSQGSGPAHGTVVMGRRINARMLADVAEQSRMRFRIVPQKTVQTLADSPHALDTPFGRGALTTRVVDDEHLLVTFPLQDINRNHLANLELTWPRLAKAGARAELEQTTWLLVLLIAGTGLAAIVVVDLLVVRRLGRLKDGLAEVVATGRWDGTLRASGRDEIAALATFINGIIGVVRRQMVDLEALALTDTLTGLANRRSFDARLGRAVSQMARKGQACALVLIDIDFFKRFNDHYGHPAGDQALQAVARCLQSLARRPGDLAARVGGEEFALLLEDTAGDAAVAVAEAARLAVQNLGITHQGNSGPAVLTLSGGVASLRRTDTPSSLYVRADQALYAAKAAGRNRVAQAPTEGG